MAPARVLAGLGLCAGLSTALSIPTPRAAPAITNAQTSLTLLYQNNLNQSDDSFHPSAIALDPVPYAQAAAACAALGETLVERSTVDSNTIDFTHMLIYQAARYPYAGMDPAVPGQPRFALAGGDYAALSVPAGWIAPPSDGDVEPAPETGVGPPADADAALLPPLCTQGNGVYKPDSTADVEARYKVSVQSAGGGDGAATTYTGFRDLKSFRFLGIRYAAPPRRWESPVAVAPGGEVSALKYGAQCVQPGSGGSEDCLFLNIQTPYLPKAGSKAGLRPVHFWIHGGGFTGGSGSNPGFDGGQLASREDVVAVTINYRLSTLGFLAVPGTNIKGNYGIADQILALDWVRANIAAFGGDPDKITINGGSAGAGSVRVLLGSPKAIGKFAGAIAMSNLGGGVSLGIDGNYATTYSAYPTIEKGFAMFGSLFSEAGCGNATSTATKDQLDCLAKVDATKLVGLDTVARYVVQDGAIVTTPELPLSGKPGAAAHVPVIFGITSNDGASFTTYPKSPVATIEDGIAASLGVSKEYAHSIATSGLFPVYSTGNVTLDAFNVSQRVGTDNQFRCVDQATVYAGALSNTFPAAYYYQLTRTWSGYDPNNLGGAPATAERPDGDPDLPYFRLHGGDGAWMFGNLPVLRDADDLYSTQASVAAFGAFLRTGDPNPSAEFLTWRGYDEVQSMLEQEGGRWDKVDGDKGPVRFLDWPSSSGPFVDVEQCKFLNYSLSYYVK